MCLLCPRSSLSFFCIDHEADWNRSPEAHRYLAFKSAGAHGAAGAAVMDYVNRVHAEARTEEEHRVEAKRKSSNS
jgi:hypothetical protein